MTRIRVFAGAALLALATEAYGGWYLMPAVRWASFTAEPVAEEATPNYYGFGGGLSLGYSIRQVFDIGAFGQYTPGKLKYTKVGVDDATLVSYGGEIGVRFVESVYVGLRGGTSTYKLNHAYEEAEVPGSWAGSSGGISLGAVSRLSKQRFVLATFDVMHHVLANKDEPELGKRRFDSFGVSISFMFNTFNNYLIENTIFKDFLDSIIF